MKRWCKCGKIAYETKEIAYENLFRCKSKGRNELSVYKCNRLNCWHLTSQNSDATDRPLPKVIPVYQKKIKPLLKVTEITDKTLAEIILFDYRAEKRKLLKYSISTWV